MQASMIGTPPRIASPAHLLHTLTEQLEKERERTPTAVAYPGQTTPSSRSPSKPRALSDAPKPSLSPSPAFREPARLSKDDSLVSNPTTPRRPAFPSRGLSLQMPQKDININPLSASPYAARMPLSPKLDSSNTYGAPSSMLPRRSRGLDYTRACTNLHHSILAEASPEASPTMSGRGLSIPQRRSLGNGSVLDSPSNASNSMWSGMPDSNRTNLSSSVSSVNMLDSDSDSDASSEMESVDRGEVDDPMLNTPQGSKLGGLGMSNFASPAGEWMKQPGIGSPAANSLMRLRRHRLQKSRSRQSSSSGGTSSRPSPGTGPLSPPLMKSIESGNTYFGHRPGLSRRQIQSRRESLSLGTGDLHLSDSEDNSMPISRPTTSGGLPASTGTGLGIEAEGPRGVTRRAVTRRSNMLPKTRNFARIKAALFEEAQPLDNELRREAEVLHQVRDHEAVEQLTTSPVLHSSGFNAFRSSTPLESMPEDDIMVDDSGNITTASTQSSDKDRDIFTKTAKRSSGGLNFWNTFDKTTSNKSRYRTPPPPGLMNRDSSSGMSDENMSSVPISLVSSTEAPAAIIPSVESIKDPLRSRSTTPMPTSSSNSNGNGNGNNTIPTSSRPQPPTAGDVARKINNKRRRDDDFDPASFKRRAVSPGMSVASSPVMPQSPRFPPKDEVVWGAPPGKDNGRSNSGGSISNGPMKRVGLQGMADTNDGLMNMSID